MAEQCIHYFCRIFLLQTRLRAPNYSVYLNFKKPKNSLHSWKLLEALLNGMATNGINRLVDGINQLIHRMTQLIHRMTQTITGKSQETNQSMCWHLLGHVYSKFGEITGLKAPGNYSASIRYNNFSICLWERPELLIFMISDLFDVSLSPNTIYVYLWGHHDT